MLFSTATVPGSAHILPGKPGKTNNQDAIAVRTHGETTVIVLADGCGSQPRSETGADIGANLIANIIIGQLKNRNAVDWPRLPLEICKRLSPIIQLIADESFDDTLLARFMFTSAVVVLHGGTATVAFFGDGTMIADDVVMPFEAPIPNTPPYIGYLLRDDSPYHAVELRENLSFKIVYSRPFTDIKKSLVVATDGIRDLPLEDIHHPGLLATQNALQFWLSKQNLEYVDEEDKEQKIIPGPCRDDVTLVVIRTEEGQAQLVKGRAEIVKLKIAYKDLIESLSRTYEKWDDDPPYKIEMDKQMAEFFQRAEILYDTAEAIEAVLDCTDSARKVHEKIEDLKAMKTWSPISYGICGYTGSHGSSGGFQSVYRDGHWQNQPVTPTPFSGGGGALPSTFSPTVLRDHRALAMITPNPSEAGSPPPEKDSNAGWTRNSRKKKSKKSRR